MKNILTFCTAVIFSITSLSAMNVPETLISSPEVIVVALEEVNIFLDADYNEDSENVEFNTVNEISVVQIFNEAGELQFQLPVMSTQVRINKNLFSHGNSKLGFILKGEKSIHFTQVTIN